MNKYRFIKLKKASYYIILLLSLLLWSCSTKKNTRMNRFYHALNSRFNIYYNGKTAFDEALSAMQNGYKENYADMILMYPISAQPKDKSETGGAFDRAIEKSNKAIKLHSIQAKPVKKAGWRNNPKMVKWQSQEEYNPFLKKCWMLMGEAQFYNADFLQASATFSYICRHYKEDEEIVAMAKLWQARCYAEMGWFYESEDILNKLNTNGIPKKNLNQYAAVYADYLIKNQRFEDAIPYMKTAIKAEKNALQRKRMKYLLGQMYASLEMNGLAYKTFGEVIRSNPPYELEFAARIRQTEVFSGANSQKVVKMLQRMAKSQKNKDYLDQVYYALGNIYLSREDTAQAIKNYELGVEKSTQNGLDKAICQIKLGDLYFERRDYVKAQPNFSGALSGIQKEYKEYDRVSKLSAILDELVVHVEAVHLQDSLQTLAKMPEQERLAVIDKIIEEVKAEEKRAKEEAEKEAYLAEQAARGSGINRPGTEAKSVTIPTANGESSFYFYNPQTVAQGKTQFQRKWGRRPLEDDWRRRKKTLSTFEEPSQDMEENLANNGTEEGTTPETATPDAPVSDDPKTREYYLQQLPMTPEDVDASNVIIEDGLYNMAMIYKDKLEDFPLSIQAFEDLEKRFPYNTHRLESYYQIYLMALRTQNSLLAEEYKNKLIKDFPGTDYAVAVADPNYEYNIRMMDVVQDSIYEQTYERYLAEDTSAVRKNYREVSEKYPLAKLLPKFMFLDALTYVQAGDADGFKAALKALLDKYPSEDVSELAGEMLKGVLRGRQLMQGGVRGMAWNLRFGASEDGSLSASDSARVFTADLKVPYRLVMLYPTGSVDKNRLLFSVAAYNFANFMVKQLDMTFENAGAMSLFIQSGFYSFDEVWHYYQMIYGKDGYASALDKEIVIIPISDDNYETLMHGKTLDEYMTFFDENFHDIAPELIARWRARTEADEDEQDKVLEEVSEEVAVPAGQTEKVKPVEKAEPAEKVEQTAKAELTEKEENAVQTEIPETIPEPVVPKDTILTDSIILPDSVPAQKEVIQVADTVKKVSFQPEKEKNLTLKDIEEIHHLQEEAKAIEKEKARQEFAEKQKAEKAMLEQTEQQRTETEAKQKQADEEALKAKVEREKQQEADRKAKLKQAESDKKAKLKSREELRKEKERAYKARLKQKEKERKEKERAYKQKLKDREKARKAELKAKEQARKEKLKK